jgi:hypothetical protein
MESSQIDTKALIANLAAKWQGRVCQMCGIGNWAVQDKAYELREFHSGGLVVGGPVLPVVPVVCSNCGNTILVSAIVGGALKREPEKVEAKS